MTTKDPYPDIQKYRCSICQRESIIKHCGDTSQCKWLRCVNTHCDFLFDNVKGIGHHLDPAKKRLQDGSIRRIRVILKDGAWHDRDTAA